MRQRSYPAAFNRMCFMKKTLTALAEAESGRSGGQRGLIVKPLPPVRQAAAPPQPVLVEHSPSYLLRGRSRQV